eukprot:Partr_v1_DN25072_c0_g1_i1_m50702 putative Involved in transport from the ER to the Golgi apparatus as well as in intra-Golgi transport. It belongs to a super-family of proteins called t-SNAREs or soluble NSF (N-ethylmaleimide- sensitive factor) attachment protein receptor (By similarity)
MVICILSHHNRNFNNASDALLKERGKIDGANSQVDSVIEMAEDARTSLLGVRSTLTSSSSRVSQIVNKIPGLGTIISKIQTRKKRDSLIIGGIIGFCIILLFFASR